MQQFRDRASSFLAMARRRFSPRAEWRLAVLRHAAFVAKARAPYLRTCNICGAERYFTPFGLQVRYEARCPNCGSLERHRLLKLWIDENAGLLSAKRILHFAPEPSVRSFIEPLAATYVTADIGKSADLRLDIERMPEIADGSFDVAICSHVLEHVDDRKALTEIHRILAPGGIALLMTPVCEGWETTYENPAVTSPEERLLHFEQHDHVRYYGADIRDRIRAAGFALREFTAVEPFVSRHSLWRGEKIFVASR